jgi:regulation of enolase protein 1 (concanavalin A-like superfamily)
VFPTQAHPCPHCGAAHELRGLRLFVPVACLACGAEWRARRRIDRFDLLEPLARGAFSMIFLALDSARGETVALKILQPPYGTGEEDIAVFVGETRRLMEIEHPHIARIFAVGVEHGLVFVAREWLGQGSLAARITRRGRLPQEEVVELGWQAASALAAAQEAGLLHRDLEPGNVLFAAPGTIKLTDFGQAVFFDRASDLAGTVWGRFCYVPPERLRHMSEDARSDMYALGATLMHALIGAPPYQDEANGEILFELLEIEPLVLVPKADLIHPTVAVVMNALLSPDQEKRPRTWAEVVAGFARARSALGKAAEFKSGITRAPLAVAPAPAAKPASATPAPQKKGPVWWKWPALGAAAVLLGAGLLWQFLREEKKPARSRAVAAASPRRVPATPTPTAPAWRLLLLDPQVPNAPVSGRAEWSDPPHMLRLTGTGTGPGSRNDATAFAAREFSNDWTLSARVTSVSGGLAGLLVRENTTTGCWTLAAVVEASGRTTLRVRGKSGDYVRAGKTLQGAKQPWLRLTRRGGRLSAAHSNDGQTWSELGALNPPSTPEKIPAGFIAYAAKKDGSATATFEQIQVP